MEDDSTPRDPLAAKADALEKALADLEAKKQAAAALAAKNAPQIERIEALEKRLAGLSQSDRREVLDAIGLNHVSAVPKPIEPLRGGGYVPRPNTSAVRWSAWLALPHVELWQAVALSLGVNPADELRDEVGRAPSRFSRLPAEFFERLSLCKKALSFDGPIKPQGHLYAGMLQSPACAVLMADVAAYLMLADYQVAEQMQPRALTEAPALAESMADRQDRRLRESEAAGLTMPKSHQGRLPNGVGERADAEGVSRQFYSDDLRAALKRREEARRAGDRPAVGR